MARQWITSSGVYVNENATRDYVVAPGVYVIAVVTASAILILGDYSIDSGLNGLKAQCDKIYICSAQPTDYASVLTTALGNKNWGAGNAFGSSSASGTGKQISSIAITNGTVTANGTAAVWAAVDSANSRLLASGPLTGSTTMNTGNQFALGAMTFNLPRA